MAHLPLALALSAIFVNLFLWIVFLIRFKRLFSTDDIIGKTRKEIEDLVRTLNRVTERDSQLCAESSQQLRALLADIEKRAAYLREEERKTIALSEMRSLSQRQSESAQSKRASSQGKKNSASKKSRAQANGQNSLFDDSAKPPIIHMSSDPVKIERDIKTQVISLARQGLTAEQIAERVPCSMVEAQMIMDIDG